MISDGVHGCLTRREVLAGTTAAMVGAAVAGRPVAAWGAAAAGSAAAATGGGHGGGAAQRGVDVVVAAGRDREGRFGAMFKKLDGFAPADAALTELARGMTDPAAPPDPDPLGTLDQPAGFTFLGQFIDHDMTFDQTPLSDQAVDRHAMRNFESARLNLSSVYGKGPQGSPELYDASRPGRLLLVQREDLKDRPRRADGSALIADPRNDENLILCQLHIAFMKLHNALIDGSMTFAEAQRLTRWHFQWIVAHDFLEQVVGQPTVDRFLSSSNGRIKCRREHYEPKNPNRPMMPIEYAVAAFRFGHSMVRGSYRMNSEIVAPTFTNPPTADDLDGSRPIPPTLKIDWQEFFSLPEGRVRGRGLRRALAVAAAVCLLGLAPAAAAKPPGTFARLFPKLDAFTVGTDQQLADLAGTMCEEQPKDLPAFDTKCRAQAAATQIDNGTHFVLGQFLDHDLTLDQEPQPNQPVNLKSLDNTRNALLDLDSVYGDGPQGSPELYEEVDGRLLMRVGVSNGIPDVPRRADGSAILADGRNDETLIIAQLHAAFLRFHNKLMDPRGLSLSFGEAQRTARHQWQWLVLNEYLRRFVGDAGRIGGYKPANKHDPVLPVEFAVAAFRFGHSQVGGPYQLNSDPSSPRRHVFSFDPELLTLVGGRPIPAGARIDWGRFFDVGTTPTPDGQFNAGRRIDTRIHLTLFQLPIPGAAASGSNLLVFRTLVRSKHYGIPSYEDVARALGITPVDVSALHPEIPAVFADESPLFYGILAESEELGGKRLGPTGARIVNEVIRTNVERDPNSYLNRRPAFQPLVTSVGGLFRFAGVA